MVCFLGSVPYDSDESINVLAVVQEEIFASAFAAAAYLKSITSLLTRRQRHYSVWR
jgi:hypothetical protein